MILQTIGSGLSVYHQDFGYYPQMATIPQNFSESTQIYGSALLGRALLSPGPATSTETDGPGFDGADGYGFRVRTGGQLYGPYLRPEKFPVQMVSYTGVGGSTTSSAGTMYGYQILDNSTLPATPILYAPARVPQPALNADVLTGQPGPNTPNPPFSVKDPYALYFMTTFDIYYFLLPNEQGYITPGATVSGSNPPVPVPVNVSASAAGNNDYPYALDRIQMLLGDYDPAGSTNFDGYIDSSGKSPITEAFILITAGPSLQYGFGSPHTAPTGKDRTSADVVTNFSSGQK
jgi:hypothetical protein